jgi:hypothetical protein
MNASVQRPPAGPEVVTQESLLLATAERVGRIREGRVAVHLHLSKLRPHNRQDSHLRIALRMLDPLVQFYRAQMFMLTNSDIIILCKDVKPNELDNLIYRLRGLFSKDPLTYADSGDGRDRFYTWYDLENEYEAFLALTQRLNEEARRRMRERQANAAAAPIEPRGLHDVLAKLSNIDTAGLVRRQSCIALNERNRAAVAFQEFFVSVPDLQRTVAPEINLTGNRWLFQHLSQVLDQRVLASIVNTDFHTLPPAVSLNLNISTTFTQSFKNFEAYLRGHNIGLVIEAQVLDVFADLGTYFYARDQLRERGHTVLLDGVTALTLQFMDATQYGTDLIKLFWSPDFLDEGLSDEVRRAIDAIGVERLVLGRCDSESAIQWGLETGIQRFQGRYVCAMQSAMAMSVCDKAARCTLQQCVLRHAVIAGRPRGECHNIDQLDAFPQLVAPRRRAKPEASS